jgi:hypothetical protein
MVNPLAHLIAYLINLINQREWCPCIFGHAHEIQNGGQRTLLEEPIGVFVSILRATEIEINNARHQIACGLSTVATARYPGTLQGL